MEPILAYGFPLGSSMGLMAALEQRGEPYRLSRVDMLGEMRSPTYAQLNDRRETPVLITDEGRVLTETMAIAAWLEARDPARRISFVPGTPEQERMHQMIAFVNTGFTAAFSPLWAALEMEPPDPPLQDILRAYGRRDVIERHDRLEAMVGDTAFLVGDRPSLADFVLIGVARWAEFHAVLDGRFYPHLAALRQRIEALPAARFADAIERGERAEGSGAFLGHVPLGELLALYAA